MVGSSAVGCTATNSNLLSFNCNTSSCALAGSTVNAAAPLTFPPVTFTCDSPAAVFGTSTSTSVALTSLTIGANWPPISTRAAVASENAGCAVVTRTTIPGLAPSGESVTADPPLSLLQPKKSAARKRTAIAIRK